MNNVKNQKTIVDFDSSEEKAHLTIENLIEEAESFCNDFENQGSKELYGITDGKAIGTFIEKKFKNYIEKKFEFDLGNAAKGIDLPGENIVTDIKVTRRTQPQSSSPFRSVKQKIYGLGYNLLLFVYDKNDNSKEEKAYLNFVSISFIDKDRTADFTLTKMIREQIKHDGNEEDIFALLKDRNLPGDDIVLSEMARNILEEPPKQGYLTISNAMQWRLQYKRIVELPKDSVKGIIKIK